MWESTTGSHRLSADVRVVVVGLRSTSGSAKGRRHCRGAKHLLVCGLIEESRRNCEPALGPSTFTVLERRECHDLRSSTFSSTTSWCKRSSETPSDEGTAKVEDRRRPEEPQGTDPLRSEGRKHKHTTRRAQTSAVEGRHTQTEKQV